MQEHVISFHFISSLFNYYFPCSLPQCWQAEREKLTARLQPPGPEGARLRRMAACLDLRKMAFDASYVQGSEREDSELALLRRWMLQRDLSRGDGAEDLPSFGILQQQFATLCERLRQAATERCFSHWKDASGTVIMRDLFTNPRLYKDVHDYLYLFAHMATKTLCEAVVEGTCVLAKDWTRASVSDAVVGSFCNQLR